MRTTLHNRSFPVVLVGVMLVMGGVFGLAQAPDWPIIVPDGGAIRTRPFVGSTFLLQAYNTTTGLPTTLATFTAGTTPTLDLAAGVTIGSAYLYRVGGTDVAVADGGTGASTLTGLVLGNGASAMTAVTTSAGIAGAISDETGTGVAVFSISPAFTGAPTFGNAATSAGTIKFLEDSDNGTNAVTLAGAASTADVTVTLPAIAGTVAVLGGGQTFSAPFYVANGATAAGSIYLYEDSDNGTNTVQLIGPASTADVVATFQAVTGTVALVQDKLSAFAATTSAEFAGVISDETGTGLVVLDTAPSFASTVRIGAAATYDGIVISPAVKGANQFDLTLSTLDLTAARAINFPDRGGIIALTSGLSDLTFANAGAIRTGTTAADTLLLQAYDTDTGPGYVTFITLTAGTAPSLAFNQAITAQAVVNPFTTAAESWIGPSSTTGLYFKSGNLGVGVVPAYFVSIEKSQTVISTSGDGLLYLNNSSATVTDSAAILLGSQSTRRVQLTGGKGTNANDGWFAIATRSNVDGLFHEAIRIDESANVGVKTIIPPHPLSVVGVMSEWNNYSASNYEGATFTSDGAGHFTIAAMTLGTGTDNVDIVLTPAGTGTIVATDAKITPGSGTGVTINASAALRRVIYKVTVASTQFVANAVTADITIATLPAKTRLVGVYADLTTTFACTATCTTATLSMTVGTAAGGNQILASFDVDAATAVFGDADAELGAAVNAAGRVQDAYIASWSSTQILTARLTSGTGNIGDGSTSNLSQGTIVFYLVTEVLP